MKNYVKPSELLEESINQEVDSEVLRGINLKSVEKITDQDLLFSLSKNKGVDNEIRVAIIKRINKYEYLINIIEEGTDKKYHLGVNQLMDKDDVTRKESLQTICEFLLRKKAAISQVKNQEYLKKFVKRPYEFLEIKLIAIQNITDQNILNELEETITDPELLEVIQQKLGTNKECK